MVEIFAGCQEFQFVGPREAADRARINVTAGAEQDRFPLGQGKKILVKPRENQEVEGELGQPSSWEEKAGSVQKDAFLRFERSTGQRR